MINLDGSVGEGGGQILRTALALSVVTRQPFMIERIRARRAKQGLLRQHLTAVKAAATISGARVTGDVLGSTKIVFEPGAVKHGSYHFAVGTAGSATLVLQTILPPLLSASGTSSLTLEGGTHNPAAPPYDFLEHTFLPLLQRMGATINVTLERAGFYPAGGGRLCVSLTGGTPLEQQTLLQRGAVHHARIRVLLSKVSERVAQREIHVLRERLAPLSCKHEIVQAESPGPGNTVAVLLRGAEVCETFVGFGERGVAAEKVAHELAGEVLKYLAHDVPVGEHLADQLLIPFALAGGGVFRTNVLSSHTQTNAQVIQRFLPVRIEMLALAAGVHEVRVGST